MGSGASASCIAALSAAALLAGCGGGGRDKASAGTAGARPSSSSSAPSPAPSPATPPTTGATAAPDAYWPYSKLIASLAGRRVAVSNASVRLDPALLECNGDGAARGTGSTRKWSRYTCTQTIFQGGADHDVTFDVVISSATQLTIGSPRTGPE